MSRRRDRSTLPATDGAAPVAPPPAPAIRFAAVILAVAGLLAYANSLSAPFVFDDLPAITDNATIRSLWPPWTALSPPPEASGAAGRPLVNLSLALNHALGGERVEGYHALNLLIHLAAGLALFGLVRRTLLLPRLRARWGAAALPVAFFTALLWTVHPLLTESVTCVVQRTESLAGLWYLLMFYCLVRAAEQGEQTARPSAGPGHSPADGLARHERRPTAGVGWLAGSLAACLLGMFTKEVMVAAPLLAVLFHVGVIDGSWRTAWTRRGRFFVLLALCWVPLAFLVAHNPTRQSAAGFGLGVAWWEYALTQCRAILHYLALSFWPHPLVLDYGEPLVRRPAEVWPQALALAGLLAATAAAWRRKLPAAFAGLWFFAILAPSSSVLPLVTQTIAEHRMYLPLAAVSVLVVTGAYALAGRRSFVVLTVLALGLTGLTVRRNEDYRTALGLWRDTVAKAPDNARAHNNLGNVLDDAGEEEAALRAYERALVLKPGYADAHYNLANILARRNRLEEAIAHYREALRLNPDSANTHNNLGNTFVLQARWTEAAAEFAAALRLNPDDAAARNNLGNVLLNLGRPAEAVPQFAAALRLASDQTIHYNLATALAATGQIKEAIAHFQVVVQQAPGRADAHYRLGVLLARTGRRDEGAAELLAALRLRPDYAEARQQLARLGRDAPAP